MVRLSGAISSGMAEESSSRTCLSVSDWVRRKKSRFEKVEAVVIVPAMRIVWPSCQRRE